MMMIMMMMNDTKLKSAVTSSWGTEKLVAFAVFLILIDGLAILGNSLVIVVILWTKNLRRREANFFVISLSLADLLVALTIVPITIASLTSPRSFSYSTYETFLGFGNFLFCICSIMNLTLLSLDRYFAIAFPYRYLDFMTRRKAYLLCLMIWIYSLAFSLPPVFGISSYACFIPNFDTCSKKVWRSHVTLTFAVLVLGFTYVLSLALMSYCYWKIFKVARSHSMQIAAQHARVMTVNDKDRQPGRDRTKKIQTLELTNSNTREATTSQTSPHLKPSVSGRKVNENDKIGPPIYLRKGRKQTPITMAKASWINSNKELRRDAEDCEISPTTSDTSNSNPLPKEANKVATLPRTPSENFHRTKNDLRVARSFLVIIGFYVLCWTPFCLLLATEIFMGVKLEGDSSLICLWIGYINSCINPFIYTWKYRQFRSALIRLWKKAKQLFQEELNTVPSNM